MKYSEKWFRDTITNAYYESGEYQHNRNIDIIIDCYIADGKRTNLSQHEAYEAFVKYVEDKTNHEKFYRAGVVDLE